MTEKKTKENLTKKHSDHDQLIAPDQVTARFRLKPGTYLIVPSTYEPGALLCVYNIYSPESLTITKMWHSPTENQRQRRPSNPLECTIFKDCLRHWGLDWQLQFWQPSKLIFSVYVEQRDIVGKCGKIITAKQRDE